MSTCEPGLRVGQADQPTFAMVLIVLIHIIGQQLGLLFLFRLTTVKLKNFKPMGLLIMMMAVLIIMFVAEVINL